MVYFDIVHKFKFFQYYLKPDFDLKGRNLTTYLVILGWLMIRK